MGLTVSLIDNQNSGTERSVLADLIFDDSYLFGGEPITAQQFGLAFINSVEFITNQDGMSFYVFSSEINVNKKQANILVATANITGGGGSTGDASAGTPTGTVSIPTFTGNALATHTHTLPATTDGDTAGTPSGTVSTPTFTGNALGTHQHSITGNTSSDSAGTPTGTISTPTFTGSALASHFHNLIPQEVLGQAVVSNTADLISPVAILGVYVNTGTVTGPFYQVPVGVSPIPSGHYTYDGSTHIITFLAADNVTNIDWTGVSGTSTSTSGGTPAGTVSTPTFTGNALGTHNHTLPANVDAASAGTPAGTISTPTFTGNALGNHTHGITGPTGSTSGGTPAGTISQPTFTGNLMSDHNHSFSGSGGALAEVANGTDLSGLICRIRINGF